MFRLAWTGVRGCFTRAPGMSSIATRTARMARNPPRAQFYRARQGPGTRAQGQQPHGSKLLVSSSYLSWGVILVLLSSVINKSEFEMLSKYYSRNHANLGLSQSKEALSRFWEDGRLVLGKIFDSEVTEHGAIPALEGVEGQIISVPDPYDPEKRFVVYQAFKKGTFQNVHEMAKKMYAISEVLSDDLEDRKIELKANRGVILLQSTSGCWPIYYDGSSFVLVGIVEFNKKVLELLVEPTD
ncbi:hypothetical protein F5Y13DRAFT_167617 [Hypoxylon sp. FL1857]|nr:hypothetical protein F5Y13DRAFT_167617 [Hypoxylon sp. FL1857]